jgi:hypothetical protein
MLSDLGRRMLGQLPAWAKDEKAVIKAETAENGGSVRAYSTAQLTEFFAESPYVPSMSEDDVLERMDELAEAGYCEQDEKEEWHMTQEGFQEIHAPREDPAEMEPGAAVVELAPAQGEMKEGK